MATPDERRLRVEALVANLDIGFIKLGQEAARAQVNATSSANSANAPPASAPGQPESFVFPVIVALDETAMTVGDAAIPLTPGMIVSVEIESDSRRVIDYLLSALAKVAFEALRER